METGKKLFMKDVNESINLYISDGAIITWNARIMLKSISTLEIVRPQKTSIVGAVLEAVAGFLLCLTGIKPLNVMGLALLVVGILSGVLVTQTNRKPMYTLRLQMDSGKVIGYQSRDKDFLYRFMEELTMGIRDDSVRTYIDMRESRIEEHVTNVNPGILYEQHTQGGNVYNGNIDLGSGNTGNNVFGNKSGSGDMRAEGNVYQNNSRSYYVLSEQQWLTLEKFFKQRVAEMQSQSPYVQQCSDMHKYAQKRDASGLKVYMQSIGKNALQAILGAGTSEVVKELLTLVLRKG